MATAESVKAQLESLLNQANGTTGKADETLTAAIASLVDGFGQVGGLSVSSGEFTVAEDYTYDGYATNAYTGNLDVDTGLSNIDAILVYSDDWLQQTAERPCFGSFIYVKSNVHYTNVSNNPANYLIGNSVNATVSSWYGFSFTSGPLLNSFNSSIPPGHFSIKTHSSTYPIKAGHTIKWIAVDGFTAFDEV